jgi:hypothetical protein
VERMKFSSFPKLVWELRLATPSIPPATTTKTKSKYRKFSVCVSLLWICSS